MGKASGCSEWERLLGAVSGVGGRGGGAQDAPKTPQDAIFGPPFWHLFFVAFGGGFFIVFSFQLGAILALTSHIWCPTLLKILTTSRQKLPEGTRKTLQTTIFFDSGPLQATIFNDFGYILQVFPELFRTLRPTFKSFFRPIWASIFIHPGAVPCIFPTCSVHAS